MAPEYLSVREAAELLRVAPGTVRWWVGSGKLCHIRIGKTVRISKKGVEEMTQEAEEHPYIGKSPEEQ